MAFARSMKLRNRGGLAMKQAARVTLSLTAAVLIVALLEWLYLVHEARYGTAAYMGPPDYSPPWYQMLVPVTVFGSLVLAPTLFDLCYRYLDKKHKQD